MRSERKKLVDKLDKVFSKYIRTRNATGNGYVVCFTCGKKAKWNEMDCGHFVSRKKLPTRWNEQNCQNQCKLCNIFQNGNQYIFGVNLDKKYGEGTAQKLIELGNQIRKIDNNTLLAMIKHFEEITEWKSS